MKAREAVEVMCGERNADAHRTNVRRYTSIRGCPRQTAEKHHELLPGEKGSYY